MTGRKEGDVGRALQSGAWFGGLPEDVQRAVLNAGVVRTLAPGQSLFEQDGPPTGLHAVLSGELRVVGLSAEGNATIMGIVRASEWVGFLTCLDGLPHAYSGVARDGARILTLSPADVSRIFERDVATYKLLQAPELALGRKIARHIIGEIGFPLAQRVAARLADLGRWPYAPPVGTISPLEHVSQEELAMSLGATRPRINAILRDFAARGMVELGYGRIRVIDAPAIERFGRDG